MTIDTVLEQGKDKVAQQLEEVNNFYLDGGLERINEKLLEAGYDVTLNTTDAKNSIRLRIDKRKNRDRIMEHVSDIISDVIGDDDYSFYVGVYPTNNYFHIIARY